MTLVEAVKFNWVELTGEAARDNACGGTEDDYVDNPLCPVKVFGHNGRLYPRVAVTVRGYPMRRHGPLSPSITTYVTYKNTPKSWWEPYPQHGTGYSGGVSYGIPIEFWDITTQMFNDVAKLLREFPGGHDQ